MPEIQILTPAVTGLGESPIWDVETERLYWIDVFGQTIFRSRADGSELTVWKTRQINALVLRAGGGAIAVAGPRLLLLDFRSGDSEVLFESEVSFNDGKVDRQGRFVTGGVAPDSADSPSFGIDNHGPLAGLYRVDTDLSVHRFGDGVITSNGPTFSPDGRTLHWSDSSTRQVYAWDYDTDTGQADHRRTLGDFAADTAPDAHAIPDGATVDAEGYRWVACFFGHEVRRYAPDGSLDRRLHLPVHSPTSVTFGGPTLDTLFITTMGMDDFPGNPNPNGPLDGSVLAVHGLGVVGLPELRFAG